MSNYDMDALLGTYADWVAWLKEKETSLAGQLARMKGKEKSPEESEPTSEAEAVSVEVPPALADEVPVEEVPDAAPAPVADDDDAANANNAADTNEAADDWL